MHIPQTVCPGCFGNKGQVSICGLCSYDETERRSPLVLPHRTVLQNQYVIGKVLGKPGGFGITYLAFDVKLRIKVAIKEFLPRDLTGRDPGQSTIFPHSNEDADIFAKGLKDFLKEAQNLAQFDHANIVRVRNFFQENSTAYIVMDYYDGITLMEYLQRQGGRMEWQMAVKIMTPIMDALREVHSKGFLHRDVKPQNIYLTRENRIILLDFGAARQAMGERTRSLTQIMTPGFAPFEQYHRQGRQGPWTDVYGVAATLYFMITGETPPEATERMQRDSLKLPSQVIPGVPVQLDKALVKGLAVKVDERFGDMRGLQEGLGQMKPTESAQNLILPQTPASSLPYKRPKLERYICFTAAVISIVFFMLYGNKLEEVRPTAPAPAESSSEPARNEVAREQSVAPIINIVSLDNRIVSLDSLRGSVVLLNFWATWCPPCREEIPSMLKLNTFMAGKPFQMVCVSVDEGGKKAVESYLKNTGFSLPAYVDASGQAARAYGITGVPETFVIDKNGVIQKKIIGGLDWSSPEVIAYLEDLMIDSD